jgi:methylaspartate ammonia-lyase
VEIVDIILSKGLTGYYLDDKHAIQKGATLDGNFYFGETVTAGFKTIRQPGDSVSFMMVLDDGQISCGDCATGQYSGIGGRDAPFFAGELIKFIEKNIKPKLIGMNIENFRSASKEIENMRIDGKRLHSGMRYGITQSILDAVAKKNR